MQIVWWLVPACKPNVSKLNLAETVIKESPVRFTLPPKRFNLPPMRFHREVDSRDGMPWTHWIICVLVVTACFASSSGAAEDSVSLLPILSGNDDGQPLHEAIINHSSAGHFAVLRRIGPEHSGKTHGQPQRTDSLDSTTLVEWHGIGASP